MRRKPITRDEARFDGRRIIALPLDSVRKVKRGFWTELEPIARLWAPLLRALNQEQEREYAEKGFDTPPRPITAPRTSPYAFYDKPRKCSHCGRRFYPAFGCGTRYCRDQCADLAQRGMRAAVNGVWVKKLSAARAAARADRKCETCGEPIKAKRSTMRFCSVKCRVAAHRAS